MLSAWQLWLLVVLMLVVVLCTSEPGFYKTHFAAVAQNLSPAISIPTQGSYAQILSHDALVLIKMWQKHYNTVRSHSSLGYRPPAPETVVGFPSLIPQISLTLKLGYILEACQVRWSCRSSSVFYVSGPGEVPCVQNKVNIQASR